MIKWIGVGLVVATLASGAFAQSKRSWWGFEAGVYRPTSSEIRERFGDTLFRFGVRPFEDRITKDWKFAVDFAVLTARKDGDRLLAVPITVGFTRSFGNPEDDTIPFVQFGFGPSYYDYSITREEEVSKTGETSTQRIKDRRWGTNANLEFGLMFNRRFSVSVRGDWYSKADDFDFSGVSLSLSYAAWRW